jgi:ParB family chromosome partitioning protein
MGFAPEALDELQASIKVHGVLQPILVRPVAGHPGHFELVAGERRWRAAAAAGLKAVPALIRHLDDQGALEAALVENLQREDLNPIERARAYERLSAAFGLTQEDIAGRVGRSQPAVANSLRLLLLPAEIQASLESGRISEGHARALLQIGNGVKMIEIWRSVEAKGLSVRATEELARRASISRGIGQRPKGQSKDLNIIQQQLTDVLGAPVHLIIRGNGSGELRIAFSSADELDRLVDALRGANAR